ncbi:MAG TPA: carbohydrate porin [Herbaspirillum sp.]|nr:carbohydrate porin [Herbaspirillum sp.]
MFKSNKKFVISLLLGQAIGMPMIANAQEKQATAEPEIANTQEAQATTEPEKNIPEERWNAKFQQTYIWQDKPSFNAPYTGPNSLSGAQEEGRSSTATAFFGLRTWQGGELYFDPEMSQSTAMSGLHGLGGLTNSEQQKSSGPNPIFYRARLFLRQTFGFGGGQDAVESGQNQLAGMVDKRRLVVTVGNLAINDIFDKNAYANDPRTQFTNWTFLTQGAYDYASDARGYSWGAVAEYYYDDWAFRIGRFMVPIQSNGLSLDTRIGKYHGDQFEIEHAHTIGDQPGKLKFLVFRNKENMGSYADAIAYAQANGGTPDVANVRKDNVKLGYGINLEQALRSDVGLFARASWNDGSTETYSFTEIENSISTGLAVQGDSWGRADDTFGLAVAQNGLNKDHREYLALGGLGAFIGDGQLINYRPERIVEAYYNMSLYKKEDKSVALMAGMQHIDNPAYNADRGPVNVFTVRIHTEF